MPAPDYSRSSWVSLRGSRVKHIGVIDRRQLWEPWRPLCNAIGLDDFTFLSHSRDATVSGTSGMAWFVDHNPNAWYGRTVCKNCIRVVEELNQLVQGVDADTERHVSALGQGKFEAR